ncbi:PREDICTED: alpha carbonic anhydrase 1, chloroplastic-like [Tarenaya hassleriana]|uniref:alpha carbonic anhydrase 1, chloroplastic-like n=1 Tax=Tarenaya hassleriana TaxID=28532 RepID=UPI00053C3EBB|nr:PREDICTED: alpha carbonic anhydrase 1, chloroplastic-like [Tarenaya hassleriana]
MMMMMMIKLSFFSFALLLCIASSNAQNQGVGFGYGGTNGPNKWGALSPYYSKCSAGKLQSPIDIPKKQTFYSRRLGSLVRDYHPANATLVNHIFNIAMFFGKGAGDMVLNGKNYTLKQMHWHTPSEHLINGVQYAAELQMVHQAQDGDFAVVATLFKLGDEEPFLTKMKERLERLREDKCGGNTTGQVEVGEVDTKHIERKTRKYFRYIGSLTTPPCSQNVSWTILGKVRSLSEEQMQLLKAPLDISYKNNSRPVQPLNGRKVEMFHELADKTDDDNNEVRN